MPWSLILRRIFWIRLIGGKANTHRSGPGLVEHIRACCQSVRDLSEPRLQFVVVWSSNKKSTCGVPHSLNNFLHELGEKDHSVESSWFNDRLSASSLGIPGLLIDNWLTLYSSIHSCFPHWPPDLKGKATASRSAPSTWWLWSSLSWLEQRSLNRKVFLSILE